MFKKELLSDNFKRWYAEILNKIFDKGFSIDGLSVHPHFYIISKGIDSRVQILDILERNLVRDDVIDIDKKTLASDSRKMLRYFSKFRNCSFIEYLKQMPPMTSADLLQKPNKICSLLTLDLKNWYAVVEVKDSKSYLKTFKTIQKLTADFNKTKVSSITFQVSGDWLLINERERHFFISRFLGITLEQQFKANKIKNSTKIKIIDSLNKFVLFCESKKLYWRDLAPRNMFLSISKKSIIFIDFENLFETNALAPLERSNLDQFRKIWFSDVFDEQDINKIYKGLPTPVVKKDKLIDADLLEKYYYDKEKITIKDHIKFLAMTSIFERKHNFDKCIVYGHRIGLYLSDFYTSQYESRVYFALKFFNEKQWENFLCTLQGIVDKDQEQYLLYLYTEKRKKPKLSLVRSYLDSINTLKEIN